MYHPHKLLCIAFLFIHDSHLLVAIMAYLVDARQHRSEPCTLYPALSIGARSRGWVRGGRVTGVGYIGLKYWALFALFIRSGRVIGVGYRFGMPCKYWALFALFISFFNGCLYLF